VVTGAGHGIGRSIATHVSRAGRPVVAVDTDAEALAELAGEIDSVATVTGDVRDLDALHSAARLAVELGGLGGWVNNAGIVRLAPLHEVSADDIAEVLGVNLEAVVLGCQVALQSFLADGAPGSIVNISSVHAKSGFPGYAIYDTAKGGVEALTRYVCVEYGHLGIRCNAVAPGVVDTAIVPRAADPTRDIAADLEAARALSPMRRISAPVEIAYVVDFLLSQQATSINGQVLGVDNGMSARSASFAPNPSIRFT
jgi:NAD(P)-dependent dehydrogenase (short-subunit alcohol dehydrogenase family)